MISLLTDSVVFFAATAVLLSMALLLPELYARTASSSLSMFPRASPVKPCYTHARTVNDGYNRLASGFRLPPSLESFSPFV